METNIQTPKKDKLRQPSAFTLPAQPGAWRYRFALAGVLFILLPFAGGAIFFLPEQLLNALRIPDISGHITETGNYGYIFWALTGVWLLWRPKSARAVAIAMAFTAFHNPIITMITLGYIPAIPVLTITSSLACAVLLVLLWRRIEPAKMNALQVIIIALIILTMASNPGYFIYLRIEAMGELGEPFWGPTLVVTELPGQVPEEYRQYELFGVKVSLPCDSLQISFYQPGDDYYSGSMCGMTAPDGYQIILKNPTLYYDIYKETYYRIEKSALSMEEKGLTSPSIMYSILRPPYTDQVYKFSTQDSAGYIALNSEMNHKKVIVYNTTETRSAEIYLRYYIQEPDPFSIAASLEFTAPAPAYEYFEAGHKYLNHHNAIDAQFAFANACWLEPGNPEYLYYLAMSVVDNIGPTGEKRLRLPLSLLEKALKLDPDYIEAAELLEELKALEEEQAKPED